jgi:hypothetical protein
MSAAIHDLICRLKTLGWSDERISFTTRLPVHDVRGVSES